MHSLTEYPATHFGYIVLPKKTIRILLRAGSTEFAYKILASVAESSVLSGTLIYSASEGVPLGVEEIKQYLEEFDCQPVFALPLDPPK